MAARMMDSAEKAGKSFTPGNMAWFAAKAARSGRRSHYTGRSDVMSPMAPSWIRFSVSRSPGW
jgi:hypothetical protein